MIKNNIAYLREEQGESLRDVAAKTKIAYPSIYRIETGRDPKWSTVEKLANHFGVSTDFLMGRTSYRTIEKSEFTKEEIELACTLIRQIRKASQSTPQTSEDK